LRRRFVAETPLGVDVAGSHQDAGNSEAVRLQGRVIRHAARQSASGLPIRQALRRRMGCAPQLRSVATVVLSLSSAPYGVQPRSPVAYRTWPRLWLGTGRQSMLTGLRTRSGCDGRWTLGSRHRKVSAGRRTVWSQGRWMACNQANLMVGCRVQQTYTTCVEKAVVVVGNDMGGTSPGVASRGRRLTTKPRRRQQRKLKSSHAQSAGHPAGWGRS